MAVARRRNELCEPLHVRAVHRFNDAADDGERVAAVSALHEREEAVLLGKSQRSVRAAAGESRNAPVRGVAGLAGVPGLVRAVEGTESEVDDPHRRLGGRVQGPVQLRKGFGSLCLSAFGLFDSSQFENPSRGGIDECPR